MQNTEQKTTCTVVESNLSENEVGAMDINCKYS